MRAAFLAVLTLAMNGCATTASRAPQAHQPIPGYVCRVSLDDRKTSETLLRADGSVFGSQWEGKWRSDFATGLSLWVTHSTGPNVNTNSFPVAVIGSNPLPGDRKRTERQRLALTNRPGTDWLNYYYAIAKSDPPNRGSSPRSLWIGWSDLLAYAEDSSALYLLSVDKKDNTVTSRPFPREQVLDAHTDITAMAQRMEAMIEDYANECEAVDDIDPLIILV